jgi:hypothetical protein
VGGALGLLLGILVFERVGAVVAATLGGAIAGLLYGALVGSFAGLESPDPGTEPSETAHPLEDPAVDEEHEPDLTPPPPHPSGAERAPDDRP